MSKLAHMAAAALFAAVAAASLIGLATASPGQSGAASDACKTAVCLVSFF